MFDEIARRGLVLVGCGKMGSAMLAGWLERGLPATSVWVRDPKPSDWLQGLDGLNLNVAMPPNPAVVLLAVKPQMMQAALPDLKALGDGRTLFLSVAAGVTLPALASALGDAAPIVRAMPNTPAAIGRGITAMVANAPAGADGLATAAALLAAVGRTVRLEDEAQMDAVTAVSGSGPAYVFHMIEALAEAGMAEGLPEALARKLALATVGGAGALAEEAEETPAELRRNVTSPNGTTQAGLDVLMDDAAGLRDLMRRTVAAAAARSRDLGR